MVRLLRWRRPSMWPPPSQPSSAREHLLLPILGRADGGRLRPEPLHIGAVQLTPPLAGCPPLLGPAQVESESVETLVPTGGVPRSLAELGEGVDQGQHRPLAVGCDLQSDGVASPATCEHGSRLEGAD